MSDTPIDETRNNAIDYGETVTGKEPEPKIEYELFISHVTVVNTPQQSLVEEICRQLEEIHNLPSFLDKKYVTSNPVNIVNKAMIRSRIIIPICTPDYINLFNNEPTSWPSRELGPFVTWEREQRRNKIIPVLLDITRDEFQKQDGGIPIITTLRNIVIPSNYTEDGEIVKLKIEEIVKIHKDYLKQWESSQS